MIGFQDESSPQTAANTVRLRCPGKPHVTRNTDKLRANLFGFYPLNGNPVLQAPTESKKEDMMDFLSAVRSANGDRTVVMILDNCMTHRASAVRELAESLDIRLVYLPPYTPHLNPIEFIWKSLKRVVSKNMFADRDQLVREMEARFIEEASKPTYAGWWRSVFYPELL